MASYLYNASNETLKISVAGKTTEADVQAVSITSTQAAAQTLNVLIEDNQRQVCIVPYNYNLEGYNTLIRTGFKIGINQRLLVTTDGTADIHISVNEQ